MKHILTFKNALLALLLLCSLPAFSQQETITIEGTVVDEMGEPLIGVAVYHKMDEETKVYTDIDGKFTIQSPSPTDNVLRFDYVTLKDIELNVADVKSQPITVVFDFRDINSIEFYASYPEHRMREDDDEAFYINTYKFDLRRKEIGRFVSYPVHSGNMAKKTPFVPFENIDYDKRKLIVVGNENFFVDKNFDHELLFRLRENRDNAFEYAEEQTDRLQGGQDKIEGYEYIAPFLYEKNDYLFLCDEQKNMSATGLRYNEPLKYVADNVYISAHHIYIFTPHCWYTRINYKGENGNYNDGSLFVFTNLLQNDYSKEKESDEYETIKDDLGRNTYYTTDGYHLLYKNQLIDKGINPKKLKAVNAHFIRSGDTYYLKEKKINKKDIFIEIVCP
ncbi:carboxypeptidase-like regulatory domain-containing protein [Dysgonomonas sp. 25]|uniref:carboxypeptidase-like regulatory domain-containing protein n=1 Tax=Dysgonomonas sp. 25 TaxID=2302933 RepID=UPI0013D16E27|nr:carboxypeptidase-like regulatory domain-containing protein [Dysgonomonas sp. 25]NDV69185.1 hypothetical protein [Dysgonomonas sp. 25]